jgi:hypothetical protein
MRDTIGPIFATHENLPPRGPFHLQGAAFGGVCIDLDQAARDFEPVPGVNVLGLDAWETVTKNGRLRHGFWTAIGLRIRDGGRRFREVAAWPLGVWFSGCRFDDDGAGGGRRASLPA